MFKVAIQKQMGDKSPISTTLSRSYYLFPQYDNQKIKWLAACHRLLGCIDEASKIDGRISTIIGWSAAVAPREANWSDLRLEPPFRI